MRNGRTDGRTNLLSVSNFGLRNKMKSLPDRLFVVTFLAHIRYLHFLEEFSDKTFPIIEDGTNDKEWNRAGNTFRCPSAFFPRNPDLDPFFLSLERKKKAISIWQMEYKCKFTQLFFTSVNTYIRGLVIEHKLYRGQLYSPNLSCYVKF